MTLAGFIFLIVMAGASTCLAVMFWQSATRNECARKGHRWMASRIDSATFACSRCGKTFWNEL